MPSRQSPHREKQYYDKRVLGAKPGNIGASDAEEHSGLLERQRSADSYARDSKNVHSSSSAVRCRGRTIGKKFRGWPQRDKPEGGAPTEQDGQGRVPWYACGWRGKNTRVSGEAAGNLAIVGKTLPKH